MEDLTIGLFGTCGTTTWRQKFIQAYEQRGIQYYNPQKVDWKPEYATDEAIHLATDKMILFPVTSETYGLGSLAETGFSILQVLKLEQNRDVLILIDEKLDEGLMSDKELARESMRARGLVLAHLRKLRLDRVYLLPTLEDMLRASLVLYEAQILRSTLDMYHTY